MEIKLPPELEKYMAQELAQKPGMDKRGFGNTPTRVGNTTIHACSTILKYF